VAVDDEYIRVNPTDGVLTAIKAAHQYETPKRHALTLPQQQAFLNFIKKTPKFQHWLPMFTFMLGTGCRISETVGLCWSDIDFESGFITIQHNLVYHELVCSATLRSAQILNISAH
jgi:integrase